MIIDKLEQYAEIIKALQECPQKDRRARLRNLCQTDLYFLLRYGCDRVDMEHPWLFERCREVQASPNGHLDLWAREHFKTTILSYGLVIFEILRDPETTIAIFSHTRPIAKAFLRQVKREFEVNEKLKSWFPDILWADPWKQAGKWSEDDGIIVQRKSNPRESTLEAWGLVDAQPTGKHFQVRIYDDLVVPASVTTPEMIAKTTDAFRLSDNLGAEGGTFRIIGTKYHFNDTYSEIERQRIAKPRIHPCTLDGSENFAEGNCVLMSPDRLREKRLTQGAWTFSCQMLLRPQGDEAANFRREWIVNCTAERELSNKNLNVYAFCDPANSKSKKNDYTAIAIIGLAAGNSYVLLDVVRDRMNLYERTECVWELHRRWRPKMWFYEEYGAQADRQHIEYTKHERNDRTLRIQEVGGRVSKIDRIRRLLPVFESGRITLPPSRVRTLHDGRVVDVIDALVQEELLPFPVASHDDLVDAIARVVDPDVQKFLSFPKSPAEHAQHAASRPKSYLPGVKPGMTQWQRHKAGIEGRRGR